VKLTPVAAGITHRFVDRRRITRAPVYCCSTATYLAYANARLGFSDSAVGGKTPRNANDAYLMRHAEVGNSLYEQHRDGSGVHYSSRLRPVLNLKPKGLPWSFTADTNLTAWLTHIGQPFDVVTDEDLHREGRAALADYRVVITGTHPEYYSTPMMDGLTDWLGGGGRLMYMGGNGFYWRIAYCPENPAIIEVRRAEDGTRAWIAEPGEYYHAFNGEYGGLWRRVGRPPNTLVGVGFAAQGFDGGTYYRFAPGACDPRVAFIMEGLDSSALFGNHGTQGGGAAGEEIDRYDASLGSPPHAVVVATSENHRPGMLRVKEEILMMEVPGDDPDVRADLTFFETPAGGAVFSTGSISYAGALSTNAYDNDVARLTGNVLRRFVDPAPFDWPDARPRD
jgi:N,N-dimethylformamidase